MRRIMVVAFLVVLGFGTSAVMSPSAQGLGLSNQARCGHGVKACDASQAGQPCDPNNLNVICSRQSNGHYCCLAYAP